MEFKTSIEINGYPRPAVIGYEAHHTDGILIYSVNILREVKNTYSPYGDYVPLKIISRDITELLTEEEIQVFQDEILECLRQESADMLADAQAG